MPSFLVVGIPKQKKKMAVLRNRSPNRTDSDYRRNSSPVTIQDYSAHIKTFDPSESMKSNKYVLFVHILCSRNSFFL